MSEFEAFESEFEESELTKSRAFTVVYNDLIRDQSISPNCRWLLIYLLSNKSGWIIKTSQIYNHVKEFMGRDALYKVIDEALASGYLFRQTKVINNLKRYRYQVADSPVFKKFLRCPDFQDTGFQDTEIQGTKETLSKELLSKEVVCSQAPPVAGLPLKNEAIHQVKQSDTDTKPEDTLNICQINHLDGSTSSFSLQDFYKYAVQTRQPWSGVEISDAWKILKEYNGFIRDPIKFIEGTIKNLRKQKQCDNINNNKDKSWKNKSDSKNLKKESNQLKEPSLESVMSVPLCPKLLSRLGVR